MSLFSFLLMHLVINCFALLPMPVIYRVADILYFTLKNILKYRRQTIRQNLSNSFPDKPSAEIDRIQNQYYRFLADLIVETLKGFSFSKAEWEKRFKYLNPEIFEHHFQQGDSIILLGSHYGNWEWGGISFPLAVRHQVVGVYKSIKNKKIENYLCKIRSRWGLQLTNMQNLGRAIIQHKKQPTIFVFIADQTPVDTLNAHWLTFLQQGTPFLHGAAKLAHKTGYPVFHYRIQRVKRGYYEVVFEKLCDAQATLAPAVITERYAHQLEQMIRKHPPYWLWSHRRWKRKRPVATPPDP